MEAADGRLRGNVETCVSLNVMIQTQSVVVDRWLSLCEEADLIQYRDSPPGPLHPPPPPPPHSAEGALQSVLRVRLRRIDEDRLQIYMRIMVPGARWALPREQNTHDAFTSIR